LASLQANLLLGWLITLLLRQFFAVQDEFETRCGRVKLSFQRLADAPIKVGDGRCLSKRALWVAIEINEPGTVGKTAVCFDPAARAHRLVAVIELKPP
jgi:hypothetical protein